MRAALGARHFTVQYQPQVSLKGAKLVGVEALLRWRDPDLGLVSPSKFIPVAEETGFIIELGNFVLREAISHAAEWHRQGVDVRVAVNVSALQLQQDHFADQLIDLLHSLDLPGQLLELDLTESLLAYDLDNIGIQLHRLAAQDVTLTIDDFGTGYSSLGYLKQLPLHCLKIDRSFVRGLPDDSNDAAIVRAIMEMAKALQLTVVAEGVETQAQRDFLERAGCQYGQGYLFAPPLTPVELEASYFPRNATR